MINYTDRFTALRSLIIATAKWQSWVGSADSAVLSGRVSWPVRSANLTSYPYVNLSPGAARVSNPTGFDSGGLWIPRGSLQFRLWDSDADPADPKSSFEAFDANVSTLLEELSEAWQSGTLVVRGLETDEPAIVHSHDNAFLLGEDPSEDDPVWMFSATLHWGFVD